MKRLTILILSIFAFCLLCVSAEAGIRHRERRVRVERKVDVKKDVKRETPIRLIPSRCQGGKCGVK